MSTEMIALLTIAGLVNLGGGAMATFKEGFASNYVRKSRKAWLLRKALGEDRAVAATRRVFGPLGMVLGAAMVIASAVIFLSGV